jgi:hypothetical protein
MAYRQNSWSELEWWLALWVRSSVVHTVAVAVAALLIACPDIVLPSHAAERARPYRYTELAALIEPGKQPKTDRNLILEDAVRVISQLRAENNQLRQLNKFLEEKVQGFERQRGQALYQQSLQLQGGLHAPGSFAPGVIIPPPSCLACTAGLIQTTSIQ